MAELTDKEKQKVLGYESTIAELKHRLDLLENLARSSKAKITDLHIDFEVRKFNSSGETSTESNSQNKNKSSEIHFIKATDFYDNPLYLIVRGNESLSARYIARVGTLLLEITYENQYKDRESRLFENTSQGVKVYTYCLPNGSVPAGHIDGFEESFNELGPELRKNMPTEWTKHLGDLFLSKE
ncbi:MAG TPA: hypothetical protein P5277_04845 [Candidatus Paceibacterota bacterium]|nr:hypothetical protein [Candidatus Paceibacterota bacterium]